MDLLKQFQPAISPEQAQACRTIWPDLAACQTPAAQVEALGKAIYTEIRNKWLETPAPPVVSSQKAFWDGIDAAGERNRQQPGETPTARIFKHAAKLGGQS